MCELSILPMSGRDHYEEERGELLADIAHEEQVLADKVRETNRNITHMQV